MADWTYNFKWQYDYTKAQIDNGTGYADEWAPTITALKRLLGTDGFVAAEAAALELVRKSAKKLRGKSVDMGDGLLAGANAGGNNAPSIPAEAKLRASALKFLAHTYLLSYSGNRSTWLHSAPKAFQHWESMHMNSMPNTTSAVRTILNSSREHFRSKDKKHIASAATRALAWVHKTNTVLGYAHSKMTGGKPSYAREQVRTWFGDPATTETDLDGFVDKLGLGFKEITATLNKGSMILTDHMGLRGATDDDSVSFRNANAFTFRSRGEGLDAVYIEKGFFTKDSGALLSGEAHWARIIIHELTHLCCGTLDVKTGGNPRYAWYGIGPHAGFTGSQAAQNADSWACFAVDCGGGMTKAQKARALTII